MPRVTVVTPNYNHARYLLERIDSILAQTFQDFELLILDNASTDNSREIIESYSKGQRTKVIFNQQNNGNTFKQWNLGLSQAKGEYLWFAESDDYADPALLETLVDRLDRHPNVGLAVCQSWAVDQDSKPLVNIGDLLERGDHSSHWREDYVNAGHDECKNYLFWHNTIPNASAVLWRRETLERAGGAPTDMRLGGDWMTYINALQFSDIAFVSTPLNYFRQHEANVRTRALRQGTATRETLMVQQKLIDRYGLGNLLRDHDKFLSQYVVELVNGARLAPHDKVPPMVALELLAWFARIHPKAFTSALKILCWEQMCDLARRVGMLGLARKLKNPAAASGG
jgi:glycosyltransferase involved in cell wall biosynthesis